MLDISFFIRYIFFICWPDISFPLKSPKFHCSEFNDLEEVISWLLENTGIVGVGKTTGQIDRSVT